MKQPDQLIIDIYTSKAQADKAISSLKGLLLGINLDGEVNEKEIRELQKWANAHDALIGRNPFNEFMNIIADTACQQIYLKKLLMICIGYVKNMRAITIIIIL